MSNDGALMEIRRLVRNGRYAETIPMATKLIQEGGREAVSGYFYRASAYEMVGGDSLEKSANDFRKLVLLAPSLDSHVHLARVLLAIGGRDDEARKMLDEAGKFGNSAVLYLGWAEFYRIGSNPDLKASRSYYLKAAMRGRFQGFFGVANTSRLLGQPIRAAFVDLLRISLGWFISILIGRRARERF